MAGDGRPAEDSAHSARTAACAYTHVRVAMEGNRPTGDERNTVRGAKNKRTETADRRLEKWLPAVVTWWVTKNKRHLMDYSQTHGHGTMGQPACFMEFEPV